MDMVCTLEKGTERLFWLPRSNCKGRDTRWIYRLGNLKKMLSLSRLFHKAFGAETRELGMIDGKDPITLDLVSLSNSRIARSSEHD